MEEAGGEGGGVGEQATALGSGWGGHTHSQGFVVGPRGQTAGGREEKGKKKKERRRRGGRTGGRGGGGRRAVGSIVACLLA